MARHSVVTNHEPNRRADPGGGRFEGNPEREKDGECASPFDQTLDELDIPTLGDIDQAPLERMSCVAEGGTACDDP